MKFLIALIFSTMFVADIASAINVSVSRRDAKFPTQQMVEKQSWTAPLASTATYIVSGTAGPTSAAAATLSTFTHQPDVPRALSITPGGTTGDVESCVVTITGTDYFGRALTEDFTFAADAAGKVVGNKAFASVTLVSWPANCESGGFAATWSIGIETKIGLKRCMASPGHIFFATSNGVKEGTNPTMAANASAVSGNTAIFNTAPDGSKNFELFFIQNFGGSSCLP